MRSGRREDAYTAYLRPNKHRYIHIDIYRLTSYKDHHSRLTTVDAVCVVCVCVVRPNLVIRTGARVHRVRPYTFDPHLDK
jgi:choline dehydrogenase-like flavoprotein